MQTVKVILRNGTETTLAEWQKLYGLPVGSDQIGVHFSLRDPKLAQDVKDYGEVIINELLMRVMDAFRDAVNEALKINAFNRNEAKQKQLIQSGYRAAVFSPHVVKMAVDIDTVSNAQTDERVKILQGVSAKLGIKIRIGYQEYKKLHQTFIHFDVCPEYYGTGKPFHSQTHPSAWEMAGLTW